VPYALSAHAKDIWLTEPRELKAKASDAAVVLTCTEEARAYVQGLVGGATQVHRIYHGVEVPRSLPMIERSGAPVVLVVARLVEKKGVDLLIRAAARLRVEGAEFFVRIAGEGPAWAQLQRLAHELGVADRVTFLGPLMESEVRTEYRRATVFALPCQRLPNGDRDGLPNVLLEAMAHGLPVVSTTLPAVREAVTDGESGLLVAPRDEVGLAEALERLFSDCALRARLGARARQRVAERFDRRANLPAMHAALASAGLIPVLARHEEMAANPALKELTAA
jgi:glycosyltransferase involved in cell wall biosynthesis